MIAIRPESFSAHNSLGNALENKEDLDGAVAAYREAIRLRPDDAISLYNQGNALRRKGDLDGAVAAYREAIRLRPDYVEAYVNLGLTLSDGGDTDGAIAAYREAIRLRPDDADAHYNLGNALDDKGDLDGAVAAYREALRLRPDDADAHYNLGIALDGKGDLDGALAAYREAIRLRPGYADAHHNLGVLLRGKGDPDGAVAAHCEALRLRPGHALAQRMLTAVEHQAALADRLPAVVQGEVRPRDGAEHLTFAELAYKSSLYTASARLWAEGFRAEPKLAEDMQAINRYNAACAAALAGCGQGKDDPAPDEAGRAGLRAQARDWLEADLTAWSKALDSGDTQPRSVVRRKMTQWRKDPDLAGVREADELAKLPEAEQDGWRTLWSAVAALWERAGEPKEPTVTTP